VQSQRPEAIRVDGKPAPAAFSRSKARNQYRGPAGAGNANSFYGQVGRIRPAIEFSLRKPNQAIRRIAVKTIVSALALVTAIFAIWGATTISAHNPENLNAATASRSINVMQMMVEAKNLPEEKFDAN
jgi:hypothetical protein